MTKHPEKVVPPTVATEVGIVTATRSEQIAEGLGANDTTHADRWMRTRGITIMANGAGASL